MVLYDTLEYLCSNSYPKFFCVLNPIVLDFPPQPAPVGCFYNIIEGLCNIGDVNELLGFSSFIQDPGF
jgi:hypothetical protein